MDNYSEGNSTKRESPLIVFAAMLGLISHPVRTASGQRFSHSNPTYPGPGPISSTWPAERIFRRKPVVGCLKIVEFHLMQEVSQNRVGALTEHIVRCAVRRDFPAAEEENTAGKVADGVDLMGDDQHVFCSICL